MCLHAQAELELDEDDLTPNYYHPESPFIDGRNSPSQTPSNMGETISLDDYTTLPGNSGATHSISLCFAGYGPRATLCVVSIEEI